MGMFINNESAIIGGAQLDYEDYIPCVEENAIEAGSRIVIEAEKNWNRILEAVGIEEVRAYSEGVEVVSEGAVGDFFQKAKEFFKNLWKKVVGLFKKFISLFDQWGQKDKAFVKKYRTETLKRMSEAGYDKDKEMEMHPFKDLGTFTKSAYDKMISLAKQKITPAVGFDKGIDFDLDDKTVTAIEEWTEYSDDLRGSVIDQSSSSESEFRKDLKEKIYGDKEDKKIDATNVSNAFSTIENTGESKKTLKKAFDAIDRPLRSCIKSMESLSKSAKREEGETEESFAKDYIAVQKLIAMFKAAQSIGATVYSTECQAIKDRNKEARAMCAKAYRRRVTKESAFEESVYTGGSTIAGVTLI